MTEKLKLVLGLLFILFMFLPLGSCEKKKEPYGLANSNEKCSQAINEKRNSSGTFVIETEIEYWIPVKEFKPLEPASWINIIAFSAPFGLFLLRKQSFKNAILVSIRVLEFISALFLIFYIYTLFYRLWYKPTNMGYLLFILVGLYFVLLLYDLKNMKYNKSFNTDCGNSSATG